MTVGSQIAALPYRRPKAGEPEVLLVTSRETRRWVIPKGWPWSGRPDHLAAAREALEEAGAKGIVSEHSIGTYHYDKVGPNRSRPVRVTVFALEVTALLDEWPEAAQRSRAWFTPAAAADAVDEPELRDILRNLSARLEGASEDHK